MYTVAVKRDFIAQHYLIGGDWGPENELNSHHYEVEVRLVAAELDQHGYLVDIVEIETELNALAAYYRDRTLNDLPEFAGLNPSLEHFARILCESLAARITTESLRTMTIRVWENPLTWAAYRRDFAGQPPA